jgi:hypothetical protein
MYLSRWPSTKTNRLNPWYIILRSLLVLPFTLFFAFGFYLSLLAGIGVKQAESFRKDWLILG